MIKILTILSFMASSTIQNTTLMTSNISFNNNTNIIKNKSQVLNLSDIKLNTVEVNVYELAKKDSKNIDIDVLFGLIIAAEIKGNQDQIKNLALIDTDIIKNKSDWQFLQFPKVYPDMGSWIKEEISILYLGSGLFDGMLSFTIKLTNTDEQQKQALGDALENKNLGSVEDLKLNNDDLWKIILDHNSKSTVTKNDIKFISIDYDSCIIEANQNSRFSGEAIFKYTPNFSISSLNPQDIGGNAYNSTDEHSTNSSITINPSLGRESFTKIYKYLNYTFSANIEDNKHGTDVLKDISSETTGRIGHTDYNAVKINLSSDNGSCQLTHRLYRNVNSMESEIVLSWHWDADKFIITATNHVICYATAWNAEWARASISNVSISNFVLS